MRRLMLAAALLAAGCGDGDPATSRLSPGDRVIFIKAQEHGPSILVEIPGSPKLDYRGVDVEPGSAAAVEADDRAEEFVEGEQAESRGLPHGRHSARIVRVLILDGSARGRVGLTCRYSLRPAPR